MSTTHYDTLEVSQKASQEVIKAAYKALMSKYHPDKHPGESTTEICSKINAAYDVVHYDEKRKAYDQTLGQQNTSSNGHTNTPPSKPYDYKWEQFLKQTPTWARTIRIPQSAWMSTASPVILIDGIYNIRLDLQDWGQKIIWAGKQNRISQYEIQRELSRTWGYYCLPNSLDMSIVQEQSNDWVNKAFNQSEFSQHENGPVKFGM